MTRPAALILFAAALALVGAALPSLALFAAGCALTFVTAGALVCVLLGARTVSISRRVPLREVEEDGTLSVFLSGRHRRWWPLRIEALAGSDWRPLGSTEIRIDVRIGPRGLQELPPSAVRVIDPLGLAERHTGVGAPVRILVLPRPKADERVARAFLNQRSDGDLEPGGLRPYVPGTKVSRIHWASLARGAELMQRDFSPAPTDAAPLVVVDTHDAVDREAVDWVARTAAAAVTRFAAGAGCRVLLPGDHLPRYISSDLRGWREVHRRLALLEPGTRPSLRSSDGATSVVSIRASDHRRLGTGSIGSTVGVASGGL